MEKVIILLHRPNGFDPDDFRDRLLDTAESLIDDGTARLRICVDDHAVVAAVSFRIIESEPVYDAMVSFWLNSTRDLESGLERLNQQDAGCYAYLVTESEPVVYDVTPGERTSGMNQVVTLKTPKRLSYEEWLGLWLDQHTQLAIDIQSTFGYRQNVVVRHLKDGQPDYAAIVEENFPPAAMSSRKVFYNAEGDEALYQQREQQMMESTMRFVDFDEINCIPMSEYNF